MLTLVEVMVTVMMMVVRVMMRMAGMVDFQLKMMKMMMMIVVTTAMMVQSWTVLVELRLKMRVMVPQC